MSKEWPKLINTKTVFRKRKQLQRKKGIALHVGGITIRNERNFKLDYGMTLRSDTRLWAKIIMVMHKDLIYAPWVKDGDSIQMIYRSSHMFVFKYHCIYLMRDYWTGRCSLSLLDKEGRRIIKRISFIDRYNPITRQRSKNRLLQRTFNRYSKLV